MISKSSLAIKISKLRGFKEHKLKLEQYDSPSELVANIVWNAFMLGDIEDKVVLDAGSGTGFFGIAALLLGAKKAYFVDVDKEALEYCRQNLDELGLKGEIINEDISKFNEKVDVVLQNPPFGTKEKHADKVFLEKAFEVSLIIYSLHKTSTKRFVNSISKDYNFLVTHFWEFNFELRATQKFHKKQLHRIEVSCFRLEKIKRES